MLLRATAKKLLPDGAVPRRPAGSPLVSGTSELVQQLDQLASAVDNDYLECRFGAGIGKVVDVLAETNAYFQAAAPWAKDRTESERAEIIYTVLEVVRVSAILLLPAIPTASEKLLNMLNVDELNWTYTACKYGHGDGQERQLLGVAVLFEKMNT